MMIEQKFVERIAAEVSVRPEQVEAVIPLFDKGATIPFVLHYRKDVTGNLDENALRKIEERNTYYIALTSRRNAVLENVAKQNKLTDDLRDRIESCFDQTILEDLYLQFKKQRRTKASGAIEQGLEPLADFLWNQAPVTQPLEEFAEAFVKPERMISSPEEALLGAYSILAERIALDPDARGAIRGGMMHDGRLVSTATKNAQGQKTKFESFYDFSEPLSTIPGQKLQVLLRGVRLGYLRADLVIDDHAMIEKLVAHYVKQPGSVFEPHFRQIVEDAYKRLLRPAIENDVIADARKNADDEAIRAFQQHAETMLLAPAAGAMPLLGLMPAAQGPCALAAVGSGGELLEFVLFTLSEEESGRDAADQIVAALIGKYSVQGIVIGEGEGARAAARFVGGALRRQGIRRVFWIFADGNLATQYAVSKTGKSEFPEADLSVRAAVALARRLQDPLAELVKLEPRGLAFGAFVHDVNQRALRDAMTRTVESCVNRVGVNLNTASADLLRYVSGIQMGTAQNIVEHRTKIGGFTSKTQLLEVPGIAEKTFEQCAGFVRIPNADNPLDATRIHPEVFALTEQIAQQAGIALAQLLGNESAIEKIDFKAFAGNGASHQTLAAIRAELMHPGKDLRIRFRPPHYVAGAYDVAELQEGAEAEGVITSITDFGVFVDIGVGQDGLVHLSELANHFIREPRGLFKIGDTMRVKVIKVDQEQRRISLSRKILLQAPRRRPQPQAPAENQPGTPGADTPAAASARSDSRPMRPRPPRPAPDAHHERPRRSDGSPRHRDKPPRRSDHGRPAAGASQYGDSGELMNTQLADQLAALRKKFGG